MQNLFSKLYCYFIIYLLILLIKYSSHSVLSTAQCLHHELFNNTNTHHHKVAIGFYGISRNFRLIFPSIQKRILNILMKNNILYDIFIYGTIAPTIEHQRHQHYIEVLKNPFDLINLLSICKISLIDQEAIRISQLQKFLYQRNLTYNDLYYDQWHDNYSSISNLLISFYTQSHLNKMIFHYSISSSIHYDAIIALRLDTAHVKDIDLPLYIHQMKNNEIWIPDFQHWKGYNDRAAYGSTDAMLLYLNRGVYYRDSTFHGAGEFFLKYYLDMNNITVIMSSMRILRVRSNGYIPLPDSGDSLNDREMKMNLPNNDEDLYRCIDYHTHRLKQSC